MPPAPAGGGVSLILLISGTLFAFLDSYMSIDINLIKKEILVEKNIMSLYIKNKTYLC